MLIWGSDTTEIEQDADNLGGHLVFVDGSASRHPVVDLRRAAWGPCFSGLMIQSMQLLLDRYGRTCHKLPKRVSIWLRSQRSS